jgi:hypothetical protein
MSMAATHPEIVERQRRITVDEYHRMIEAGIRGEDEHVQLVAGTLVAMTPQGSRHAVVIQRLTAALVRAVGDDLAVRPQLPLTLLDNSEPEPDLAVVGPPTRRSTATPEGGLVGGSRLAAPDREQPSRAQDPGVLIVNLAEPRDRSSLGPDRATGVYRSSAVVTSGETLVAGSVPNLTIDVASLFG